MEILFAKKFRFRFPFVPFFLFWNGVSCRWLRIGSAANRFRHRSLHVLRGFLCVADVVVDGAGVRGVDERPGAAGATGAAGRRLEIPRRLRALRGRTAHRVGADERRARRRQSLRLQRLRRLQSPRHRTGLLVGAARSFPFSFHSPSSRTFHVDVRIVFVVLDIVTFPNADLIVKSDQFQL